MLSLLKQTKTTSGTWYAAIVLANAFSPKTSPLFSLPLPAHPVIFRKIRSNLHPLGTNSRICSWSCPRAVLTSYSVTIQYLPFLNTSCWFWRIVSWWHHVNQAWDRGSGQYSGCPHRHMHKRGAPLTQADLGGITTSKWSVNASNCTVCLLPPRKSHSIDLLILETEYISLLQSSFRCMVMEVFIVDKDTQGTLGKPHRRVLVQIFRIL